ncbi:MAG: homocysteine S-methyltransferase family protein [Pseudomonadota bacterium]
MDRYRRMMERIAGGARILMDGATGTEVERRGAAQLDNAWNAGAALCDPDLVRQVHVDYLTSGAELIISNTFATTLHALADAGEGTRFEAYNRRGVELAVEARTAAGADTALVAGGISYWSFTGRDPTLAALGASVARQAAIMAEAGADLLVLEMMVDLDRMLATLDAAMTSGLPVWVGMSCAPNDDGTMCLWNGAPLAQAISAVAARGAEMLCIMHTEVAYVEGCLDVADAVWRGPVCVYAHSGRMVGQDWTFDGVISPEAYAAYAARWLARGVQVIGGCCGVGPAHIALLRTLPAFGSSGHHADGIA